MINNNPLKGLTILLISLVSIFTTQAQCYIKSTEQGEGYVTYYMDPELVAQTSEMGIATSVQSVGDKYYLAVTYQFAGRAQPVEERIALNLKNGYTIELDMYTMEVGNRSGIELCMAVFNLGDTEMSYLRNSPLKSLKFSTKDEKIHVLEATSANDVLVRQIRCFEK